MDLYEAIEKRRTIRKFKEPASEEQLKRIIGKGTLAPSAKNTQQWAFVMVDDPASVEKISELKYLAAREYKPRGEEVPQEMEQLALLQKNSLYNASLLIAYHTEGPRHGAGTWCFIQNMLLSAVAEGLSTKITYFDGDAAKEINKLMGAPEGMHLAAAISIGVAHPDYEPHPRDLRPQEEWLHRNRF